MSGAERPSQDEYAPFTETWELRRPVLTRLFGRLPSLTGTGLDLACGPGYTSCLLADLAAPPALVYGLDINPASIELARRLHQKHNRHQSQSQQQGGAQPAAVRFLAGDALHLPFEEGCLDWAGAVDMVGAPGLDPRDVLAEMARVVKPGGTVFLANWSGQLLLPGFPALEARLNQTASGLAPFAAAMDPRLHISRALGWFDPGLYGPPEADTAAGTVAAPLDEATVRALEQLLAMRWNPSQEELGPDMHSAYRRLCMAGSSEHILRLPDYYGYFTYSIFYARRNR